MTTIGALPAQPAVKPFEHPLSERWAMKRYEEREELHQTPSAPKKEEASPESDVAKAAYAWNNALKLAAEKMWGERFGIPPRLTVS
ncbi:hypothetical protein GMST_19280 [Geomonas silvestris]|uniref:Uncharacterized protein n=1 Tax=Geomonas silvestris TaxID=2740184 RepID=A0A6V8MII1_9BACT|nr:hypothetical protein [Geomonas silvestris]GFO59603.1 hypothetical protein GMST_19280 [Geomonas silvestris]